MSPQHDLDPLACLSQQEQSALFQYLMNGGSFVNHDQQVQVPACVGAQITDQQEEAPLPSILSSYLVPPQEESLPLCVKPNKPLRSGNSTPRPANCFILFRRHVGKFLKLLERDHRLVSRLAGHCWNHLPESGKSAWRHKAEREKIAHKAANPEYTYSPVARRKKAAKRKVKRNGEKDLKRCRQVADMLLAGKVGSELHQAVRCLDASLAQDGSVAWEAVKYETDPYPTQKGSPLVQSPLLPPPAEFPGTPAAHESLPLPVAYGGFAYNDTTPFYARGQVVHDFSSTYTQPAPSSDYMGTYAGVNHFDNSYYPVTNIALDGTFEHFDCSMTYIPQQNSIEPVFDAPNWFPHKQFAEQVYIAPY